MRKVIRDNELQNIMSEAIDLICDSVKTTLGPSGNNVLISSSDSSPFITNDGVTIARNVCSDDEWINAILEIVKESSLKTDELVGDGTTTTLVLLQSIYNLGLNYIKNGYNRIKLKEELNMCLSNILEMIELEKINPNTDQLLSIAVTSSNSNEIGNIVNEVYRIAKSKYSIKIEESNYEYTYYETKKGYSLDIDNISSLYFRDNDDIYLSDSLLLVLKGYLSSLEQISDIINDVIVNDKKLVILVEDFDDSINQELLSYYLSKNINIFIFKIPDYASHRDMIETDISTLSGSNIKNVELELVDYSDIGSTKSISINKNELIIYFDKDRVNNLVNILEEDLDNNISSYEKDFIFNRLSKLKNGITTIYVGGVTKTEIREKMMRYEDCLCAIDVASSGIVVGEGITLLKVSSLIDSCSVGDEILKQSLQIPFDTICENTFVNDNIKDEIINSNYKKIYDFDSNLLIDIGNNSVYDPIEVVKVSLKNAVSIASLLLTTSYLVINENLCIEKEL